MEHRGLIQQSLDYIEANLKTDLDASALAKDAGFSLYHYCRIFQAETGLPVKQYILRRRLLHAVWEAAQGEKLISVALDYGFDTHAGFFRAFMREFGCPPSVYLKRHPAKKPARINLMQGGVFMLAQKKLREILTHWGMEESPIRDFYWPGTGARAGDVWQVGTGWILKTGEDLPGLETAVAVCRALAGQGISVPLPLPTKRGEDYLLRGSRWFYLMNRLPGERLQSRRLLKASVGEGEKFGRMIGQLHGALAACKGLSLQEKDLFEDVKAWALPRVKELGLLPAGFGGEFDAFMAQSPRLPRQPIHRDLNPSNLILTEGKPGGFVDFELCEENIRLFDPCYFCTGLLSEQFEEASRGDSWFEFLRSVLGGYDAVRPLTEEEKAAAPWVVLGIELICVGYFTGKDLFGEVAQSNRKMLAWLWKNRDKMKL